MPLCILVPRGAKNEICQWHPCPLASKPLISCCSLLSVYSLGGIELISPIIFLEVMSNKKDNGKAVI